MMACRRLDDTSRSNLGSLNLCVRGFGFAAEKYCSTVGRVGVAGSGVVGGFDQRTTNADPTNRAIRISGGNSFFIVLHHVR